jgi:AraC family transcriptional regulator, transcriptional activator of pobA
MNIMKAVKELPVLTIKNFEDYNKCQHCGNSFYIREFRTHLKDNLFLDHPHSHDFFIILLITKGAGVHNIDFKSYEVCPNTVFFLTPGQVHNWELSEDVDGYILFFTKEYLLIDFNHNKLLKLPFFYSSINAPFLQLEEEDVDLIKQIFVKVDLEYLHRKRLFHDMVRLNLNMLLIELERRYKGKSSTSQLMKYQENLLHKFETLVDEHYKAHKPVTFYAAEMNISLKQLSTLCKKALSKTPGDIIQERVILEAKRLLVHSDFSVSFIAQMLNYLDISYFIRLFRKVTGGITPEQFRLNTAAQSDKIY